MEDQAKITNSTQEISFSQMLQGNSVANIPLFQRGYAWGKSEFNELYADIFRVINDDTIQSQFMGVVIVFEQSGGGFGSPNLLDVVDGQQRLFTCYLTILAAQEVALDYGDENFAIRLRDILCINQLDVDFNTRLVPPAQDRWQFSDICTKIATHKNVTTERWGDKLPRPPKASGERSGRLEKQYNLIKKTLKQTYLDQGKDGKILEKICRCVTENLGFIIVTLKHPASAPDIFERLNSRGVKITTADLVRNEIFSRLSDDPDEARSIYDLHWKPFENKYDSHNVSLDSLLFPYGLMIDSNIKQANLFNTLRLCWKNKNPEEIIKDLEIYTPALLALKSDYKLENCPENLRSFIARFKVANLPTATYSFVLRAIQAVINDEQNEADVIGAFGAIDSLLVRRAIKGIEPGGLHAIFKGMWRKIMEDGDGVINFSSVKKAIGERLPWPDDDEFIKAILEQPLYGKKIAHYVIGQYEQSVARETPNQKFEIEHIIPKTPNAHWSAILDETPVSIVHTWGNLIPLTSAMNKEESRNPFAKKKLAYKQSMFASSRTIHEEYPEWNPDSINYRGKKIAKWASVYWPK
ncbi:DUF262 domain-containing HNH endonuclease family protein [Porticoccaceae bacterium]|nr:DUF262 domain-containing HNH endonuclease family protein [Porticoccaceae bacterium]